jgi:hypothetical protein
MIMEYKNRKSMKRRKLPEEENCLPANVCLQLNA